MRSTQRRKRRRSAASAARRGPTAFSYPVKHDLPKKAKASRRSAASTARRRTNPTMHYVYILESLAVPGHFYIGSTDNLRQRLRQHQADVDTHAAKYRPWKLKTYLAFEKKATAVRFESYLKSGSGRSFCKRHFD